MAGIFEGLKVLDCASFIAAPAAAAVLSDFGAEVIKIEPPGTGDPYRLLPKLPGYPISEDNYAWLLESRNKRSLALDLSKAGRPRRALSPRRRGRRLHHQFSARRAQTPRHHL